MSYLYFYIFFFYIFYNTNTGKSFHFVSLSNKYNDKYNDKHIFFMKKDKSTLHHSITYKPKNINQEKYVKYLNNDTNKLIVAIGPAGTGKTIFACLKAIELLKSGNINKIIITRPAVSVDEEIGFLPGNIIKKMDPWTKPIFDIFLEYYSKNELDSLLNRNIIEICPLAFMRGRTFKNAFIIADEMQNSSPNQMKMLTTRIGIQTKMVITGDLMQSDLYKNNGLYDFIEKVNLFEKYNCFYENSENSVKIIKFDSQDIERSDIVQKVIDIYDFKIGVFNVTNTNSTTVNSTVNSTVNATVNSTVNATINSSVNTTVNATADKNEKKNTNKKVTTNKKIKIDSNFDAALIPLHHISKNNKFT